MDAEIATFNSVCGAVQTLDWKKKRDSLEVLKSYGSSYCVVLSGYEYFLTIQ